MSRWFKMINSLRAIKYALAHLVAFVAVFLLSHKALVALAIGYVAKLLLGVVEDYVGKDAIEHIYELCEKLFRRSE